jgi:uncharacterized protein
MTANDDLPMPPEADAAEPIPLEDAAPLAPVAAAERFPALDVVRGFALLGIFLMNVEFFWRPMQDISQPGIDPDMAGAAWWADALVFFFVQNKFWTLFSLLFGMGFAVMIDRARKAGRPFVPAYLRRSLALMGIGAVHAMVIWSGDILLTYSIGALLLLAARAVRRAIVGRDAPPMPAGTLFKWGAALYGTMLAIMLAAGLYGSFSPPPSAEHAAESADMRAEMQAERDEAARIYATGTFREAVGQRVVDTGEQMGGSLVIFLPLLLGVFTMGVGVLRSGVVEDPRAHRDLLVAARNVGLPVGFAIMALSTWLGTGMMFHRFGFPEALQAASYLAAGPILALAYGATVTLALDGPAGGWLRNWLGPAGRMALTNYLTQSVVGTLVFYGYGLGWFGKMDRQWQVAFVFGVFALQLVLSRAWLAVFRFGPAEWLWRALTYLQLPPIRRAPSA